MRILGLDFGARRIGVAVSDPTGSTAQPLTVIEKSQKDTDVQKIKQLIDEYDVE
ncbi:MAG: Holliday junction resolvase RuvX, partial [Firmicutes bacterium]|nr:Holliday junction resolvase RuvX [Bacillota bacterium]